MARRDVRLDKYLRLNEYISSLFGKKSFQEFQSLLGDSMEGFNEERNSYVLQILQAQQNLRIAKDRLSQYDGNIHGYMNRINKKREKPVKLKYFQYLSVLFTEIFMDKYFSDPVQFLNELNEYVSRIEDNDIWFSKPDLNKLAFWMATGSGKTLIFHINYLQIMKYNRGPNKVEYDNILLITPSESLSDQHMREMTESSIHCDYFSNAFGGYFSEVSDTAIVKVIDIHKLTEVKTGQGVSVHIEEFGTKNLIFVDEGHKGSGGVQWRRFREYVSREGFTFEYSATFGQAIKNDSTLLDEYGKSIVFDYSYRHFYNDGYGKEYRILNLKDEAYSDTTQHTLMLANLLTFYEQILLFQEKHEEIREYNIEDPLWIFVGSKVQGKNQQSDILEIVKFIDKVLRNNEDWVHEKIKSILEGKSGLLDKKDRDLFSPEYPEKKLCYLKEKGLNEKQIYEGILSDLFHTSHSAPLHIVDIKNATGEIALKAGNAPFFGVINIGDTSQFIKLCQENTNIIDEKDDLSKSLFKAINSPESKINILIGAKKFLEGWNSWRVSNMGLLNVGRREGSQIIQLFGRGVRLRGKNFSLKRSSIIETQPPKNLKILETLNIFGIKANYMDQFREHLEVEGINTDNYVEKIIPITIDEEYLNENLLIPTVEITKFKKDDFLKFEVDDTIHITLDLMPKVEILTSLKANGIKATHDNPIRKIEPKYLELLDWDTLLFELLQYKKDKRWDNIIINKETLKLIIQKDTYSLHCPEGLINPKKFENILQLQEVVVAILKKYFNRYYTLKRNQWTKKNIKVEKLTLDDDNLNFKEYTIKIKEEDTFILTEIEQIIEDRIEELQYEFKSNYINNIYIDRHIYQPLLAESRDTKNELYPKIHPGGLNTGEQDFITDLKNHITANTERYRDTEFYILRNLPKRGVGFFQSAYFYPDFILWIKTKDKQHLLFIDPKGLGHIREGLNEEKIQLHNHIKDIEQKLHQTGTPNITLDSYIISVTPYANAKPLLGNEAKSTLKENHILFQPDDKETYIQDMLQSTLVS